MRFHTPRKVPGSSTKIKPVTMKVINKRESDCSLAMARSMIDFVLSSSRTGRKPGTGQDRTSHSPYAACIDHEATEPRSPHVQRPAARLETMRKTSREKLGPASATKT